MPIAWRETMSLQEPYIDHQHRNIIDTINMLEKARDVKNVAVVGKIVSMVLPYLTRHFQDEETHFELIRFAQRDWHKKMHADLLRRLDDIVGSFKIAPDDAAKLAVAGDLGAFLQDYIFDHLIKEDMKAKSAGRVDLSSPVSMVVLHEKTDEEHQRRKQERNKDVEYALPPHLQHLLKRLDYEVPEPSPPQGDYPTFEMLCEGAILRRIDKVLIFFQRRNPAIERELPPFFLASPKFREKFYAAINKLILPVLWEARQVRALSASLDISRIDSEGFWNLISDQLRLYLMDSWRMAWDQLKPVMARKEDGRQVLKVKEPLKRLREMLQPDDPADYDLPRIGSHELDVFSSLLDLQTDWWNKLNHSWKIFLDLYEQEKDPRVFQERGREGALRDYMLQTFDAYPIEWLDFILLAAHAVFPRITTRFLDSFSTNYSNRDSVLPFTMRYLDQVKERPEIVRRELREEDAYAKQRAELRKVLTGRNP